MRQCALLTLTLIAAATTAQAAPPMRIAVFVDNSSATSAALPQIRDAVAAFFDALPADSEAALITTGRRPQVRVQPTTDLEKLKSNAAGLLTENGPTSLIDALQEIEQRFLRKPGDRWPVMVIVTGTGSDNSNDINEKAFNRWVTDTAARGLSANAVVLKTIGNTLTEVVATAMVKATGGHYAVMSSGAGMTQALTDLARQLATDAAKRP